MYLYPYFVGVVIAKGKGIVDGDVLLHSAKEHFAFRFDDFIQVGSYTVWKKDVEDIDKYNIGDRVRLTLWKDSKDYFNERVIAAENINHLLTPKSMVRTIVDMLDLWVLSPTETRPIIEKTIRENPEIVSQYRNGNKKIIGVLLGKINKESRFRTNMKDITPIVLEYLK